MIISIASGKGGTGKTTVAASFVSVVNNCVYLDCDVEEPNGHLLLNPKIKFEEIVFKKLPEINYDKCNVCGKCTEVCEFNALTTLKFEILIFEEMCHSCGACMYFCPEEAIKEISKEMGKIKSGITNNGTLFYSGELRIGEVSAVPLIKKLKSKIQNHKINIIDSPPGTSCSMSEAVTESDYCILVTESSPFGLSDLKLTIEVLETMKIPFGVIINKYDKSFTELEEYLKNNGIEVLLKIAFERKIAEAYSIGILPVEESIEIRNSFVQLYNVIEEKVSEMEVERK